MALVAWFLHQSTDTWKTAKKTPVSSVLRENRGVYDSRQSPDRDHCDILLLAFLLDLSDFPRRINQGLYKLVFMSCFLGRNPMLWSVRKKFLFALVVSPVSGGIAVAQSPVSALTETNLVNSTSLVNSRATVSVQTNDLFVNQWVHVDQFGSISGSVSALVGQDSLSLPKMKVSLSQGGTIMQTDDTDVGGDFLMEKVSPGLYTLTAEGGGSMAMFSVVVLNGIAGKHLPGKVGISVMPASGRVSEIIQGLTIPKTTATASAISEDPLGSNRKFSETHRVILDGQGTLSGRLGKAASAVDMSKMTVFIMKDGQEIKRAKVAMDGTFSVPELSPSCYGLVAAGDQGVAVTGFCAVNRSVASKDTYKEHFVAQSNQLPSSLNIEVCDQPGDLVPTNNAAVVADTSVASPIGMAPGFGGGLGGGGSFGGGGGSGGIGGGIGALAGIGGLIAVGIIAADKNKKATVTSPIAP